MCAAALIGTDQVIRNSHLINHTRKETNMAKNLKNKNSKASSLKKTGLKAPVKTSKVEATKFRLALNHNETLLK